MNEITPIGNPVITSLIGKTQTDASDIFGNFFSALIGLMLALATIWAFLNLIQGGLAWMSSSGDKGKLEEAQGRITNAVIGLFIVFAIWAIYLLILQFLGITSGGFNITLPKLF